MTTGKTTTADNTHWTVLLPNGDTALWDGVTMPIKLGRNMIQAQDGRLINPEQVVAVTPPSGTA